MNTFKSGDVVQLKSGGPLMTVRFERSGEYYCEWFDGKEPKGHDFWPDQLKLVNAEE